MQTTDTVQQRLDCVYQRKAKVTLADLLTAAHTPADLRSYAFQWAILKLAAKMDDKTQEYQDFKRDLQVIRHCGRMLPKADLKLD
jgi:predicted nucleotidyltransferase